MKIHLLIILTTFSFSAISQSKRSVTVSELIDSLQIESTEINRFNHGLKSDTVYFVYDKWTSHVKYKPKSYVDNLSHKLFLEIVKNGNIEDFDKMLTSDFPNIRVYGIWAIKKQMPMKFKKYKKLLMDNKSIVHFNGFGDLISPSEVRNLINKLK